MAGRRLGGERLALGPDHTEQCLERLGELLDAVVLEHAGDVGEVHSTGRQPLQEQVGVAGIVRERAAHGPVILEEAERCGGHGIDRIGADERVHVEDVRVARVLGAGAGPQEPLRPGAGGGQPLPGRARQMVAKPGVGQARVGDRDLAAEIEQRAADGVDAAIRLRVHPAHEERGDGGEPIDRLPRALPGLERADVGFRHFAVVVEREQQRDVHVDPAREEPLDRRPPFLGAGHLDHQVGPVHRRPQPPRLGDRSFGVAGERGRDLEGHEAVLPRGAVVHRPEEVRGVANVVHGEPLEDLQVALRGLRQRHQLVVVVTAPADGVLEDGRIRGHAPETVVDQLLQLPGPEHPAAQVVQPYALPELEQGLHGGTCR